MCQEHLSALHVPSHLQAGPDFKRTNCDFNTTAISNFVNEKRVLDSSDSSTANGRLCSLMRSERPPVLLGSASVSLHQVLLPPVKLGRG